MGSPVAFDEAGVLDSRRLRSAASGLALLQHLGVGEDFFDPHQSASDVGFYRTEGQAGGFGDLPVGEALVGGEQEHFALVGLE